MKYLIVILLICSMPFALPFWVVIYGAKFLSLIGTMMNKLGEAIESLTHKALRKAFKPMRYLMDMI